MAGLLSTLSGTSGFLVSTTGSGGGVRTLYAKLPASSRQGKLLVINPGNVTFAVGAAETVEPAGIIYFAIEQSAALVDALNEAFATALASL